MLPRRARAPSFLALKAANFVWAEVHRKNNKAPGDGPTGLSELLGEGSYGKVYRSRHREEDVAIKWLKEREALGWIEEVAAYSAVPQHEHIVQLLDVLCEQDQFGLVFPLYETN